MKPKWQELDEFTRAYITCALWVSNDESDPNTGGDPLDKNYDYDDISEETIAWMIEDCKRFQSENAALIAMGHGGLEQDGTPFSELERAGHDLWLSRNRHGSGYFDGDWGEVGDTLQECAEAYGECHLEVGDDKAIYHYNG